MKSYYKFENEKVIEQINIDGTAYSKTRETKFMNETYVEFRDNNAKITFLLKKGEEYEKITDDEKLRKMLDENYIIKKSLDII